MRIVVDDVAKRVRIWVNHDERDSYKQTPEYKRIIRRYREQSYDICVYIGGNEPLLPNISALLEEQGVTF